MAVNSFKIKNSANFQPQASAPTTPIEGDVYFDHAALKLKYHDGTAFNDIGSGGLSDPSIITILQSDLDSGTWLTGNNAAFLGGGSLVGTFTKQDATSPLNGTYSYTYTNATSAANDYIASPIISVYSRSMNKTISVTLPYTYNGTTGDIKAVLYDVTNSAILSSATDLVANQTVANKLILTAFVPATCTQLRFGFQTLVANNGKILKFDDVELSDNPFVYKNILDSLGWYAFLSNSTPVSKEGVGYRFPQTATNYRGNLGLITTDSNYRFTFTKPGNVTAWLSKNDASSSSSARVIIYNAAGTVITQSGAPGNASDWFSCSVSYNVIAGDYLCFDGENLAYDYIRYGFDFISELDSVVTPAKQGMELWTVSEAGNAVTNGVGEIQFSAAPTVTKNGAASNQTTFALTTNLVYHNRSADPSKFYASKPCIVSISLSAFVLTTGFSVAIYKNGTVYQYGSVTEAANELSTVSTQMYLNGTTDYFSVGVAGDSLRNAASPVQVSILAINDTSTFLAALPITPVYAEYESNAGQVFSTGSYVNFNFEDKIQDSHNAVTIGASWKFTAPCDGVYSFAMRAEFTAAIDGYVIAYVNGSEKRSTWGTNDAGGLIIEFVEFLKLNKGDYVEFKYNPASGTRTMSGTASRNKIAISNFGIRTA